jgi:hypothetical protein
LKTSWFCAVLRDAISPIDFNLLRDAAVWGVLWWKYFVREMETVDCLERISGSHAGKTFLTVFLEPRNPFHW